VRAATTGKTGVAGNASAAAAAAADSPAPVTSSLQPSMHVIPALVSIPVFAPHSAPAPAHATTPAIDAPPGPVFTLKDQTPWGPRLTPKGRHVPKASIAPP
jgi:hypothetical protein